ncbi:type VII secretion integral membrane protein EccD [Actinosynnema sp. ALI-1.44]|uniref:type VII secretion integral membrane protein EccD n=1 Tax=Actinosynnema sp. ALI-1.44 TaxID=1933779 RepID=UPI00097BB71F|nr:type VII secretion integral membrane protein EccD [Actinosynnema sp. ALI-1.44]ONI87838.1 type VII secretion integral membrane protein EccD [Actinosynnema sp. ALI-1.44]
MEEQTQHRTTSSARLRFVLGKKATDVALPTQATLIDLLPAVLPQFGAEWIEQGADHEGWVVQRIGEPPLDEDRTLAELNLLDGETVYLRPRADQLAAIDYDDLVDGVGEQVRDHSGAWRPAHTRWMFRVGAAVALLLGLWLVPGTGSVLVQAFMALCIALLLVGGSALVARGVADPAAATIMAIAAASYGALGGVLLVRALDPIAIMPVHATVALAVALLLLCVGVFVVADAALVFTGAIMFTAVLAIAGLIASVASVTVSQAVGIGLSVSLVIGVYVPATAFRLSGLTLPMLPTGADELSEDIDPVPAKLVVERGTATAGYSTALHVGLGAALTVMLPMLIAGGDSWARALSLVIAFLLLLRTRHPSGAVQRWAIMVPAAVTVVENLRQIAAGQGELGRLLATCAPLFALGLVMLLFSRLLPGQRFRPYWGRAVEILETLTAVAVIPILLQVLGVYAWMRGLAG